MGGSETGKLLASRFRGLVRSARPERGANVTLRQRQIYILPTKYGLILGGLLFLMLVSSLNYASNLGFLYTFLLSGAGLVSVLHTWRNLLGLRVRGGRAESVFAGQDAWFAIELENPHRQPRPGIERRLLRGSPRSRPFWQGSVALRHGRHGRLVRQTRRTACTGR